jgi:acyl dehydratase
MEIGNTYHHQFVFTQAQVNDFAQVSGDTNPLHLDADFASTTPFKKPIMHGFLGGSIFSMVLGTKFPGPGSVYLKQSMEFLRPMFVEQTYEAIFTVKELELAKNRVLIETKIVDTLTGKTTITGEALIMNKEQVK